MNESQNPINQAFEKADLPKSVVDFLDVTTRTQLISPASSTINHAITPNFVKTSEEIWSKKGLIREYQKGLFFGRGDSSNILLHEFMKKFKKLFEDMIREELKTKELTFESFKDDFKTFETLVNMIFNHLSSKDVEIKNERNIAMLHGFINAYVDSLTSSEKIG